MNATEHKSIGVLRTISTLPSYYHLRFAIRWSTALRSTNWLPIFRKRAGVSGKKNIHRLTWTTTINTTINSLPQKLYQDRVTCYDQVSLKTFVEESALVSEIWHRWSLKCSAAPCPVQCRWDLSWIVTDVSYYRRITIWRIPRSCSPIPNWILRKP